MLAKKIKNSSGNDVYMRKLRFSYHNGQFDFMAKLVKYLKAFVHFE
jgi:hypothetical protein